MTDPVAQAQAQFADGQFEQAAATCQALLADQPDPPAARHLLGLAQAHLGQLPEALGSLAQAAAARPAPDVLNDLGYVRHLAGQSADAVAPLEQALAADPSYLPALHTLALVRLALGHVGHALRHVERALALQPDFPEALVVLAQIHAHQGQWTQAARDCRKALEHAPTLADAHLQLGLAQVQLGTVEEAAASFDRAVTHNPHLAEAHYQRGLIHHGRGETSAAQAAMTRAVAAQPRHVQAHLWLGLQACAAGAWSVARPHLLAAWEGQPPAADLASDLGMCCQNEGLLPEAEAWFREALGLEPGHLHALPRLGATLAALDRPADAIPVFDQAIVRLEDARRPARARPGGRRPGGPTPAAREQRKARTQGLMFCLAERAKAHTRLGQHAQAAADWAAVLELAPDDPQAAHMAAAAAGQARTQADPRYVTQLFDWYADRYDQHLTSTLRTGGPQAVADLLRPVLDARPGQAVLDLGCGTGLCGALLKPAAGRLDGVDLSPRMVELAQAKNLYDRLAVAEATAFLRGAPAAYDVLAASDVFGYVGALADLLAAAHAAARPGGHLAFTCEDRAEPGYGLQPSGRFAHHAAYVQQAATAAGWKVLRHQPFVIRVEDQREVPGRAFLLARP